MLSAPMDVQQLSFDDDEPYQPSSTLLAPKAVGPDSAAIEAVAVHHDVPPGIQLRDTRVGVQMVAPYRKSIGLSRRSTE